MPYFTNYNRDDDENRRQVDPTGNFQRAGGAPGGAGAGAEPGAAQANAAKTGSNYQNLDSYLNANAGLNFGGRVTDKVGEAQAKGYEDQRIASEGFRNQVHSANQVPSAEDISGAIANPAAADPAQYQNWLKQGYRGPRQLSDSPSLYGKYWGSTNKAKQDTGLLNGTNAQNYTLLDSYFGGPETSYNKGQKGLDLTLAKSSPDYGGNSARLQNSANNLLNQGTNNMGALTGQASDRAGQVEQSRNAAQQAIGVNGQGQIGTTGAVPDLHGQIFQEHANKNAANFAENKRLQDALTGQGLNSELSSMGFDPNQPTYGNIDVASYFTPYQELNPNQTMTSDQQARLKALEGLAGIQSPYAATDLDPQGGASKFDADRLRADIQANADAYHNDWNSSPAGGGPSYAQMQQEVDYLAPRQNMNRDSRQDPAVQNNKTIFFGAPTNNGIAEQDNYQLYRDKINNFKNARGANNKLGRFS